MQLNRLVIDDTIEKINKIEIRPRTITLFEYGSEDEHMRTEALICLKIAKGKSYAEYRLIHNETGNEEIQVMNIPAFFFVFHQADELMDIIREKFRNAVCVRISYQFHYNNAQLAAVFNEYKVKSESFLPPFIENLARACTFHPKLQFSQSRCTHYYVGQYFDKNKVVLFGKNSLRLDENQEQTLCVYVLKDNHFQMGSMVARFEDGRIHLSEYDFSLPTDFYLDEQTNTQPSYPFYEAFVQEHQQQLPAFGADLETVLKSDEFRRLCKGHC